SRRLDHHRQAAARAVAPGPLGARLRLLHLVDADAVGGRRCGLGRVGDGHRATRVGPHGRARGRDRARAHAGGARRESLEQPRRHARALRGRRRVRDAAGHQRPQVGPGGGGGITTATGIDQFGGTTGLGRLFNNGMGDQVMWLAVFAGAALVGGLVVAARRRRRDAELGSLVVWGGWALVTYLVFAY